LAYCFSDPDALIIFSSQPAQANESLYQSLSAATRSSDLTLINSLIELGRNQDWTSATEVQFEGNLRFLEAEGMEGEATQKGIFLVRELDGRLYLLSIPETAALAEPETAQLYEGLEEMLGRQTDL
jgi:hypothetical protein